MARPRKDDPFHLGPTASARIDAQLASKINVIISVRKASAAPGTAHEHENARVLGPVLEDWLDAEFRRVPTEIIRLTDTPSQWNAVIPREKTGDILTAPIRLPVWTVRRLAVLSAVRCRRVAELISPILARWVDAECDRLGVDPVKIARNLQAQIDAQAQAPADGKPAKRKAKVGR